MRAAFAVALTVALLAVSQPAIEAGGVARSDAQVRDAIDALEAETRLLRGESDALPGDVGGGRRTFALYLPTDGFASAGIETFRLRTLPKSEGNDATADGRTPAVTWRVEGGTRHAVRLPGSRLRPAGGSALELREGGRHQVALSLVESDEGPVVRVGRTFKYRNGTTADHAGTAGPPARRPGRVGGV